MKSELIVGDTLDFLTQVPDYPASEGWVLTYKLIPRVSGTVISFNAAAEGDDYRSTVEKATTALWATGEYSWSAYVTFAGERHTVDQGLAKILPDPAAASAYDGRSHARKVLDAIEAVIESRATKDQEEYTIGQRSLKRTPLMDLLKLRDTYRGAVFAEEQGENANIGKQGGRLVVKL